MPATLKHSISYPAGTVAPNVPAVMQTTAQSVEAALEVLAAKLDKAPLGQLAYLSNNNTSIGLAGTGVLCDYVQADLVAGRLYRATYRVNTVSASAANMAIAVAMKRSASTDVTVNGTDLDDAVTIYSAPVANQGCTSLVTMTWRQPTSGLTNIKVVMARASGATAYDISMRKLAVYDDGAQF